jgi:energy-coupling factor transport system ATP-binding protein
MDSIKIENVNFSYPAGESDAEKLILDNLSLEIKKGEFVAVLGHNGSGKSTLAKLMNAILVPTSGDVVVYGNNTKDDEKLFDIRKSVGMVFQNPDNQIVATIVEEDVAFGLENLGVPQEEMRERVDSALKSVEMYDYRLHAPHKLSGGQKQRVAIAGIIAMQPRCIVLDEPTAMLDPRGRLEVMKTVRKLNREFGITVVLITHYMEEAAGCDRVIVIDSGKVLLDDSPREVFSRVSLLKSVGLDVPQVTDLMYSLSQLGIDVNTRIITEDECFDELFALMKKSNHI